VLHYFILLVAKRLLESFTIFVRGKWDRGTNVLTSLVFVTY